MILRLKRKEAFFAFPEKGENFSVFLWVIPRGEAPFQVLRLGSPTHSVPSIFFGSPKSSRVLAWQRVLGGAFLSPSILRKQRRLAGRPPQRPVRSSGPGPLLKRVHSSPFLASLVFKQGEGVELSFPERKVRGWGLPKQGKGGLQATRRRLPYKGPGPFQASFAKGRSLRRVPPGSLKVA